MSLTPEQRRILQKTFDASFRTVEESKSNIHIARQLEKKGFLEQISLDNEEPIFEITERGRKEIQGEGFNYSAEEFIENW